MTLNPRPAPWRAAGTEIDVTSLLDGDGYVSTTVAEAMREAAERGKTTGLTRSGALIAEIGPPGAAEHGHEHEHTWKILATQRAGAVGQLLSPARTYALMRCKTCGLPSTVTLAGHWDAASVDLS